jgi:sortase A
MKEKTPSGGPSPERLRRSIEVALFLVAIVCLGTWTWSYLDSHLFQAYESWRFSRQLESRPTPAPAAPPPVRQLPADTSNAAGALAGAPPSPAAPPAPVSTPLPEPPEGQSLGRLEVPRLDVSVMVAQGVSGKTLRRAAGHIPGTALPGQLGNVGIAGHRDTFFRSLKDIRKNDTLTLKTLDGTYQYVVDATQIVSPDDVHVLDPTGHPTLTLVTCYPFYYVGSAPQRFIVQAHLGS